MGRRLTKLMFCIPVVTVQLRVSVLVTKKNILKRRITTASVEPMRSEIVAQGCDGLAAVAQLGRGTVGERKLPLVYVQLRSVGTTNSCFVLVTPTLSDEVTYRNVRVYGLRDVVVSLHNRHKLVANIGNERLHVELKVAL